MKAAGFSLIEVLVATAVVTVGMISLAQLIIVSGRSNRIATGTSTTLLLAERKMEELVGETDLNQSPSGSLFTNTSGFIDYLDASGVSLGGTSVAPPAGAGFVCRWSIEPLPNSAVNTLVLQVVVLSWPIDAGQTRLVTVKFRKGT